MDQRLYSKEKLNTQFEKEDEKIDYQLLVQRLEDIKKIIALLEKKFVEK